MRAPAGAVAEDAFEFEDLLDRLLLALRLNVAVGCDGFPLAFGRADNADDDEDEELGAVDFRGASNFCVDLDADRADDFDEDDDDNEAEVDDLDGIDAIDGFEVIFDVLCVWADGFVVALLCGCLRESCCFVVVDDDDGGAPPFVECPLLADGLLLPMPLLLLLLL